LRFPAASLHRVPDRVGVRARAMDSAFPMRVRQPISRFWLEGGGEIDLTAAGHDFQFTSDCLTECPLNTVISRITFISLRQIGKSGIVDIDALGFAVRLKSSDLQSLRTFIDTVSQGIEIR
jgi:hypothetical protein